MTMYFFPRPLESRRLIATVQTYHVQIVICFVRKPTCAILDFGLVVCIRTWKSIRTSKTWRTFGNHHLGRLGLRRRHCHQLWQRQASKTFFTARCFHHSHRRIHVLNFFNNQFQLKCCNLYQIVLLEPVLRQM